MSSTNIDQFLKQFEKVVSAESHFTGIEGLSYDQAAMGLIEKVRQELVCHGCYESDLRMSFLQEVDIAFFSMLIREGLNKLLIFRVRFPKLNYLLKERLLIDNIVKGILEVFEEGRAGVSGNLLLH